MNQELYQKLFARMDELGAIRKDKSFWCEIFGYPNNGKDWRVKMIWDWCMTSNNSYWSNSDEIDFNHKRDEYEDEIIWHPPVLSDCIKAHMMGDYTLKYNPRISEECQYLFDEWELSKPYLSQQSEELGQKLISSLS